MPITVLMLEFHECITKATKFQPPSGAHRSDAVALVEHRGSLNFQSEIGKRQLVAVRHELASKAFEMGESISPIPAIWRYSAPMSESPAIALDVLKVLANSASANLKALIQLNFKILLPYCPTLRYLRPPQHFPHRNP
jgi:hypothetical protein